MSTRNRSSRALAASSLFALMASPAAGQMDADRMPPVEEPTLSYMMSAGQKLGTDPSVGRFQPHVMFHVPYATEEQLGSNPAGSPGPLIFEHEGGPYSSVVVVVPDFVEVSMPSAGRGG